MTGMRVKIMCAVLLTASASGSAAAQGESSGRAVLNGIHYSVLTGSSRLLLSFTGSPVYSASAEGRRFVIACSRTQVGSPPGAARLMFNEGGLVSVVVERFTSDSAAITLTMRPGMAATASLQAGSGTLLVEVKKGRVAPVDVRALCAAETPAAVKTIAAPPRAPRISGMPVFATALIIAAASTVLILLVVVRAGRRTRTADRPAPCPAAEPLSPGAGCDAQEEAVVSECPLPDEEEAFFGVGKDLRGVRQEFALAMRLHSGPMGDGSRRKARSACSEDATLAERVKVARKLGIGRGEIDLALRLQKLENRPAEGENA